MATGPWGRVRRIVEAAVGRTPWSARIVAALSLGLLSACGTISGAAITTAPVRATGGVADGVTNASTVTGGLAAFYQTPVLLAPERPGTVIRSMVIPSNGLLPRGAVAYRVLYHSETVTGADTAVSGMVVVPGVAPPTGGYPIVTWAHGTTGLADQCAPSLDGFTSIPLLDALLDHGDIVAATDYEGLGTPGVHPYLVGQSEGQNVLDAARAARYLVGATASDEVAVVGYSQGGQAALFASQIAPAYAPDLVVVGTVAAAPVTSLDEFIPQGTSTSGDPAAVYAVMALDAWAGTYGNLDLSSVLTPAVLRHGADITTECSGALAALYDSMAADQVFTAGWAEAPGVQADLDQNEPGREPSPTPLLVVEGAEDTLTPSATVSAFVSDTLCRSDRDTVTFVSLPQTGHGGVMLTGATDIVQWLSSRLAHDPVPDSCAPSGRPRTG